MIWVIDFSAQDRRMACGFVLSLMLGLAAGLEVATIWVFGPVVDLKKFAKNPSLESTESPGFIKLSFDGSRLEIELVRRPSAWPDTHRFCSVMLPAAVHEFFALNRQFSVSQIDEIGVVNLARPREAGCRCYTRLMLAMGVDTILGSREVDPVSFCLRTHLFDIVGNFLGDKKAVLPDAHAVPLRMIREAASVTTTKLEAD